MTKKILVIEGDDQRHFFLSVEGETVRIGDKPAHAEMVLRDLHISRIHCEFEVSQDRVMIGDPPEGSVPGDPKELHSGQTLHIGHTFLRLTPAHGDFNAGAETFASVSPPLAGKGDGSEIADPAQGSPSLPMDANPMATETLPKKLVVFDGADQGRSFPLYETGSQIIGKHSKIADIVLNDLYVARVHCGLEMQGDKVMVTPQSTEGTLINGQRIAGPQELHVGDVLRVGNSHLRLEYAMPRERKETMVQAPSTGVSSGVPTVAAENAVAKAKSPAAKESPAPSRGKEAGEDPLLHLENHLLGHYQIGPLLGRGHSGVVFRAQDVKTNQLAALKVLRPEFPANPAEMDRFAQALKVAAHHHHHNLIALHGAGKSGAYCWIAREYIEGESVARLIQRLVEEGKLGWKRGVRVAIHLGQALAFLHQHQVSHGNVTPQNVLIRSSDKLTKLTDLMLAQALQGSRLCQALTDKKRLADLPYLAPEQLESEAWVDHLADLYSLGALLFTLIAGQPPFTGDSPHEILPRIRKGKIPKPSKFQPGIPVNFEAVILKLLAKDQKDRYQTAPEMLADLEPIAQKHDITLKVPVPP